MLLCVRNQIHAEALCAPRLTLRGHAALLTALCNSRVLSTGCPAVAYRQQSPGQACETAPSVPIPFLCAVIKDLAPLSCLLLSKQKYATPSVLNLQSQIIQEASLAGTLQASRTNKSRFRVLSFFLGCILGERSLPLISRIQTYYPKHTEVPHGPCWSKQTNSHHSLPIWKSNMKSEGGCRGGKRTNNKRKQTTTRVFKRL